MIFKLTPFSIATFITAIVNIFVTYSSWQRRKTRGGVYFTLAMAAMVFWTLSVGMYYSLIPIHLKVLAVKLEYLGNMVALACFAAFSLSYAGYEAWLKKIWVKILLFGIPAANILLAWTNDLHRWLWTDFIPSERFENVLIFVHGPAYTWVVIAGYGLVLIGFASLLAVVLEGTKLARKQAGLLLFALLVLVSGHLIYLFDIFNLPGVDWSSISYSITGLLLLIALHGSRFMDIVPVARKTMIERMPDGVLVLDPQGHLVDCNPAAQEAFDLQPEDLLTPFQSALKRWPQVIALLEDPAGPEATEISLGNPAKYYDLRLAPLLDHQNHRDGLLVVMRDITQRKLAEAALANANQQLEKQLEEIEKLQAALREEAIRDSLTHLYNRRFLLDALERELLLADRLSRPLGIILLDIDHFKSVNDTHGHFAGDEYLAAIAQILLQYFRKSDIICRYGGEEFLVVMPGSSLGMSTQRAEKFRQLVASTAVLFGEQEISCTISIGVAAFPEHGEKSSELIQRADQALYASKQAGRDRVTVWGENLAP